MLLHVYETWRIKLKEKKQIITEERTYMYMYMVLKPNLKFKGLQSDLRNAEWKIAFHWCEVYMCTQPNVGTTQVSDLDFTQTYFMGGGGGGGK